MKYFILVLSVLCIAACKKKDNAKPIARVKNITRSQTGNHYDHYEYNSDGSLNNIDGVKYTRSGNTIAIGTGYAYQVLYLNNNNLVDSAVYFSPPNVPYLGVGYKYNEEGYLVSETFYDLSGGNEFAWVQKYTISEGNLIHKDWSDQSGEVFKSADYTYDLAAPNTVGNEQLGQSYLGKSNKNMQVYANEEDYRTWYTNHYNANGFVDTVFYTMVQASGDTAVEYIAYTYY